MTKSYILTSHAKERIRQRYGIESVHWYAKGGVPVRELIYGLDVVYRQRAAVAVITEAEIDAMSAAMAVAGESYIGIATGGSKFSREKAELLMRSPLERLIVASDNETGVYIYRVEGDTQWYNEAYLAEDYYGPKTLNVVPITEATEAPPTIDAQIDAVLDEINDNNALIKTFGDAEYLEKGRQLSVKLAGLRTQKYGSE